MLTIKTEVKKLVFSMDYDQFTTPQDFPDVFGEYTESPDYSGDRVIIDRKHNGDQGRNEFRYWQSYTLTEDIEYYRKNGYAKHESWLKVTQFARKAYQLSESFGVDWGYMEYKLTAVTSEGFEKSDYLGGVDSASNSHVKELVADMAYNLLGVWLTDKQLETLTQDNELNL